MDIEKNLSAIANQLSQHGMTREAKAVSIVMQRVSQKYTGQDLLNNRSAEEIKKWQQFLASQGFQVAVDGIFGPETEAATRKFQSAKGILSDGLVGPETMGSASQAGFGGSAPMTAAPAAPNAAPAAPNAAPGASPSGGGYLGNQSRANPEAAPVGNIFADIARELKAQGKKASLSEQAELRRLAQKAQGLDAQGRYSEADEITLEMSRVAQSMQPTQKTTGLQDVGWMSEFGRGVTNMINKATIGLVAPLGGQNAYKQELPADIKAVIDEVSVNKALAQDPKTRQSVLTILDNARIAAEQAVGAKPQAPTEESERANLESLLGKRPKRTSSSTEKRTVLAESPDMLIGDLQRYLRDFANRNVQKFGNDTSVSVPINYLKQAFEASLQYKVSQAAYARSKDTLNPQEKAFLKEAAKAADQIGLGAFLAKLSNGNYPAWQKQLAPTLEYYYTKQTQPTY